MKTMYSKVSVSKASKFYILFYLAIPLLGIYYNKIISNADKDLCTMIFFEALFIIIRH